MKRKRLDCAKKYSDWTSQDWSKVKKYLAEKQLQLLDRPGNSADMNPIENVWKMLKDKMHECRITAKQHLIERLLHSKCSYIWNLTDNYRTARLKLPVAERHSDLQTAEDEEDDEIPKRTKRRKIANTRFDSDSDGDVCSKPKSHLPPPPKITPPQKFSKSTTKMSADLGELGQNAKSMCRMHQSDSVQLHSECRSTECGRCTQEMKSLRNDYKNQSASTVEEHLTPECVEIANTAFRHWSTSQQNGPNQDIYGPILRNILVKQEMMMEQVKVILKTVQDLHEKCCSDSGSDPVLEKDILPLQDLTSMQQLESDLAVGGDLKKKLVRKNFFNNN
ncbi:uncharacterized protein LOC114665028 [Erpetoichthys calabaricus]|uniref:uncharacterized protein LOC114665028 n=1 Tax=Erpetoichthys calabaricus TaxID=27687 RepID=UPI0022345F07|nr:uncharacterized protein LOC114665028 [Erpetoichthys calabaricus]